MVPSRQTKCVSRHRKLLRQFDRIAFASRGKAKDRDSRRERFYLVGKEIRTEPKTDRYSDSFLEKET